MSAGLCLTIHSSRTRFVASRLHLGSRTGRLNSGVSRQTRQDQKRCVESAWRLSRGNVQQLRAVKMRRCNLRALVSGIRKSFAFGSTAIAFLRGDLGSEPWNRGFQPRALAALHLRPHAGQARRQKLASSWRLPSNNSFKPKPLRSSKNHGKKSLPCFCFHYAFRLNSGVRAQIQ